MKYDRKRALALKAADARELLKAALPDVLNIMSNAQVVAVQKVLDAAVVNPVLQREYADTMRRSIVAQSGPIVNRDERLVRRANRIFEQQIPISDSDKRVRVDHNSLLTSDAFALTTNNPDEADFLGNLREFVNENGIWLRFEPEIVRDPEDPSCSIIDKRRFRAWLSLGRSGDYIPTKTGMIDRKALLGAQTVGASYYRSVEKGPYMKQLENFMAKLFEEIQDGQQENMRQDGVRATAFPLVPTIADAVGGADFPDPKTWEKAWELYHFAWKQRLQGNVLGAMQTLMAAAILTQQLAQKLNDYINDTLKGASTVVKVAVVLATVAAIIDAVMLTHSLGGALMRRWAMRAASAEMRIAARKGIAREAAPPYKGAEAYQRTHYAGSEATSNATKAVKKFDPKATKVTDAGVGDFINVDEADWLRRGEGWKNDMFDWLLKNQNAPLADKLAALEKFEAKWNFRPSTF